MKRVLGDICRAELFPALTVETLATLLHNRGWHAWSQHPMGGDREAVCADNGDEQDQAPLREDCAQARRQLYNYRVVIFDPRLYLYPYILLIGFFIIHESGLKRLVQFVPQVSAAASFAAHWSLYKAGCRALCESQSAQNWAYAHDF